MTKNFNGKLLAPPNTNYKAKKNIKLNVHSYFLSLAHSDTSGYNTCPMANKVTQGENSTNKSSCSSVCVAKNGKGSFPNVINSRIRKTKMFFEDRDNFMNELVSEIYKGIEYSKFYGFIPTFRLNAYSDIKWENIKIRAYGNNTIFSLFPDVKFYDYTKLPNRVTPPNYELTYSHWGSWKTTKKQLKKFNVAMVFSANRKENLPETWKNLPVVDGDKNDLRTSENDGKNVIVGLRAKMSKKNIFNELNKPKSFLVQA